jgi:hypothetical protein
MAKASNKLTPTLGPNLTKANNFERIQSIAGSQPPLQGQRIQLDRLECFIGPIERKPADERNAAQEGTAVVGRETAEERKLLRPRVIYVCTERI